MAHIAFVHANLPGPDAIRCAKEAGHRVSFVRSPPQMYVDSPENARIIASVDRLVDIENTSDTEQVIAALRACDAEAPLDLALSQSEWAMEATALAARALHLPMPFTDADAVLTARRKHLCRERLRAAGVPSARFALARTADEAVQAADAIGYPVVAKPSSGTDSILAAVALDSEALRHAAERILAAGATMPAAWQEQMSRGVLVEERLEGQMVSAEIGVRGDEHHLFCVSGRFRGREDETVELGSFVPAAISTEEVERCEAYALAVCRAIGLDRGIFHIEIMLTGRGPILVEANPRLMGGGLPHIYECATAYNIHRSLLQIFTGTEVVGHPRRIARCAAGKRIKVRAGGVLPARIDFGWLEEHRRHLVRFDDYGMGSSRTVKPGEVIGRVVVCADDHRTAIGAMDDILRRVEASLDLPLMIEDRDRWS